MNFKPLARREWAWQRTARPRRNRLDQKNRGTKTGAEPAIGRRWKCGNKEGKSFATRNDRDFCHRRHDCQASHCPQRCRPCLLGQGIRAVELDDVVRIGASGCQGESGEHSRDQTMMMSQTAALVMQHHARGLIPDADAQMMRRIDGAEQRRQTRSQRRAGEHKQQQQAQSAETEGALLRARRTQSIRALCQYKIQPNLQLS